MHRLSSQTRCLRQILYRAFPVLVGTCATLATLAAVHLAFSQRENADLRDYGRSVLEHAQSVASESVEGLDRAASLPVAPCSEADLAELRYVAFHSRYIKDVGRVQAGRVACTAIWGRLPAGTPLAEPSRRVKVYSLWTAVPSPGDARIRVDMVSRGNAIVTTSPTAFDTFAAPEDEMGARVVTRDGGYTFQSLGYSYPIRTESGGAAPSYLSSRLCSARFDLCVVAQGRRVGLLGQPAWTLASIALLALTGGVGLGALLKVRQSQDHALDRMLAHAIRHGDIDLVYQPLRRLADLHLVGVEALARWRTPTGVNVPPDVFVPMAERLGLGAQLARLVIVRCLEEIGPQLEARGVYVSINLSAQDVLDSHLRQFLSRQAALHGVPAGNVVLEMTERTAASQEDLLTALADLQTRGFRVYLDDFGTGYSNFAYLADLPLAGLKMDRRFTRAVGTRSAASHAVEAICVMALALGLPLVAEGVETEKQAASVAKLIPTAVGQGWYLGRPCAADAIPWETPRPERTAFDGSQNGSIKKQRGSHV